MKIAYLDCFSGVSGDMLLGALLDAGLPATALTEMLDQLDINGYRLTITETKESSIKATRVQIQVEDPQPAHRLKDIQKILAAGGLNPEVRDTALEVFQTLARAEAQVHGCSMDEVHFHEVGGIDTIIDVVATVAGFYLLGIDKICCSPLPLSSGWVACDHGHLPLPAPAVCTLLEGLPVYGEEINQELVTPTGAALIRTLATEFGPMPPMQPTHTGYGAGSHKRKDKRPNLLRLMIGESHDAAEAQQIIVIETALDDWSPETWPHVAEKLLQSGALDVLLIPIQMKKGRPGFLLRIVCEPAAAEAVQNIMLSETTAIGLRSHREQRRTLPREIISVQTRWGKAQAKKISTPDGTVITPEYEECRRLANTNRVSIRQVYDEIRRCTRNISTG